MTVDEKRGFIDSAGEDWLLGVVNRCQAMGLAPPQTVLNGTLQLLASVPAALPPLQEAVVRRVLARTAYCVGPSHGLADNPRFLHAIMQLAIGVRSCADTAAAIHKCMAELEQDMPGPGAESAPGPATMRWVSLVSAVARLSGDVATISQWARAVGKSQSVIKTWCAAAGVSAGDTLDFARVLRVAMRHAGRQPDWRNMLDIIDHRTLVRLLDRCGLRHVSRVPDAGAFMKQQQIVLSPALLSAIQTACCR